MATEKHEAQGCRHVAVAHVLAIKVLQIIEVGKFY